MDKLIPATDAGKIVRTLRSKISKRNRLLKINSLASSDLGSLIFAVTATLAGAASGLATGGSIGLLTGLLSTSTDVVVTVVSSITTAITLPTAIVLWKTAGITSRVRMVDKMDKRTAGCIADVIYPVNRMNEEFLGIDTIGGCRQLVAQSHVSRRLDWAERFYESSSKTRLSTAQSNSFLYALELSARMPWDELSDEETKAADADLIKLFDARAISDAASQDKESKSAVTAPMRKDSVMAALHSAAGHSTAGQALENVEASEFDQRLKMENSMLEKAAVEYADATSATTIPTR